MLKTLTTVFLLISTSAFALDQEYLGYWVAAGSAPLREVCLPDGSAGFRITRTGTTEYNNRCRFIQETRDGTGWKVRLSCAPTEGGKSTVNLRWQIMPDGHLKETRDESTDDYIRCPTK